jgi:hypothetical protein
MRQLGVLLLTFAAAAAVAAQAPRAPDRGDAVAATSVHLRGLDTLNGQARDIIARVGETVTLGHLVIVVHTCRVPVNTDGEAMVFLTITDTREAEPRFSGWMFASSPALSALDHPRYDVWVQSCSNS